MKFVFLFLSVRSLYLWMCLALFFLPLLGFSQGWAQSEEPFLGITVYDADLVKVNTQTGDISLDGNASLLMGRVFISADRIQVQKKEALATAEGSVKIFLNKEKATASRLMIDLNTNQVRMDNAEIFSDPLQTDEAFNSEALGLTKAEIAFETERQKRVTEIKEELSLLREKYSNLKNLNGVLRTPESKKNQEKITEKYAKNLRKLEGTEHALNPVFGRLSPKEVEKYIKRREAADLFIKKNPETSRDIMSFTAVPGYLKLAAGRIVQLNENIFLLNNSMITPCRCSSWNEPPAYSFFSQSAEVTLGEYVTLESSSLNLFSVPVIYIPWMILPVKYERESGFLIPSGYASNNAGQAISVPYFIDFGSYADTTLTYQYFSLRGTRLQDETRVQLTPESQLYLFGEVSQDRRYNSELRDNNNLIDQAIANNPANASTYEGFRGSERTYRWYTDNNVNIPIDSLGSVKTRVESVSDSLYFSDFSSSSSTNPATAVYGDTTAAKRFLGSGLDAEYYGDDATLTISAQSTQDLFAMNPGETPRSVPKMELNILPKRYFDTPFVMSHNTTGEYAGNVDDLNLNLSGYRLYTNTKLSMPMPENPYVNASVSASVVATQYAFENDGNTSPYQAYVLYSARVEMPLYLLTDSVVRADLAVNPEFQRNRRIEHVLTPYVNLDYVPHVARSSDFPTTYKLWYAADEAYQQATFSTGLRSAWSLVTRKTVQTQKTPQRLFADSRSLPVVGDLSLAPIRPSPVSPLNVPAVSSSATEPFHQKSVDFYQWAEKELDGYHKAVMAEEFEQPYIWPEEGMSYFVEESRMTPLVLDVSFDYNALGEKTAEERNAQAGPDILPFPTTSIGDINGHLTLNLHPLVPLSFSGFSSYSKAYGRINSLGNGVTLSLPYGFAFKYFRNIQYLISTTSLEEFIRTTGQTIDTTYTPIHWLKFGFQWSKNTDPTSTADTSEGRAYATSYNVNLLNFQDCLDLILSRNKPSGTPEREATYAIGFNLKFFGYTQSYNQTLRGGEEHNS